MTQQLPIRPIPIHLASFAPTPNFWQAPYPFDFQSLPLTIPSIFITPQESPEKAGEAQLSPNYQPTSASNSISVSSSSSRCSSVESAGKIRRGRPQQAIEDSSDLQSQKKKHRRMYARQYRAEMRQKVDNIKSTYDENKQLREEAANLRGQVANLQQELLKQKTLVELLQISKKL